MLLSDNIFLFSIIGALVLINLLLAIYILYFQSLRLKVPKIEDNVISEDNNIVFLDSTNNKVESSDVNEEFHDILISRLTEERLIADLEKAEKERFFLQKGVTRNDLADILGTNRRYISYILKKHRNQDFNNYVQFLRISYLLSCIEEEPELLNQKFSILAEKFAFPSHSKFSTVFKSVIGISPTDYFEKYKKDKCI